MGLKKDDIARINATDNGMHSFVGKITKVEHGSLDYMVTLENDGFTAYAFMYQLCPATHEEMIKGWKAPVKATLTVIFEEHFNQGEITKLTVSKQVLNIGQTLTDPQSCFDQLHAFFKSVPHYYSYRGHNHVAVHMKQPNGLPQPVRQFLIIKSEGD